VPGSCEGSSTVRGMNKSDIVIARHAPEKRAMAKRLRRDLTPTEWVLWAHLRANRLRGLHFRKQQIIDGFIADFYCHRAGLVVEVDGGVHEGQAEYDVDRDAIISARGLHVLRFPNERIHTNLRQVLAEIYQAAIAGIDQQKAEAEGAEFRVTNSPSRVGRGPGGG
jgi:very-short-patch-repair endonuclease